MSPHSKWFYFSFLQILAPELNDRMLADVLDMEISLAVSYTHLDVYKRQDPRLEMLRLRTSI